MLTVGVTSIALPVYAQSEKPALDLVHENVTTPAVLHCRPNVPLSLYGIFEIVQNPDIVTPGDLCNKLLHYCLLGPRLGEGPHVLQIPRRKPPFISGNAAFRLPIRRR
jgi:hypothetical protein